MRSKKSALASVLLFMALGTTVGCTEESEKTLVDPQTGEPFTEQELRQVKSYTGLSEPTQKELNEFYMKHRRFGGPAEVHPNALAAQDD